MPGFVDMFRFGMGWWSVPPAAPVVIGSLVVDRVEAGGALSIEGIDLAGLGIDDYDLTSDVLTVEAVETR